MNKRIGILGGTFDPIHYGHLRSALDAQIQLELDEVRFIPCHIPPHKQTDAISSSEQRSSMTQLAISDQPSFTLDTRELEKNAPSYTYETLQSLREEHPDSALFFIMGMDSLLTLHTWHRWQELLTLSHLVVTKRPGNQIKTANQQVAEVLASRTQTNFSTQEKQGSIYILETLELEISSTDIRNLVGLNQSIRYLLPDAVVDYIHSQQLYRGKQAQTYDNQ